MLLLLLATTRIQPCLVSQIFFPYFSYWFKTVIPCFVTSDNVCKLIEYRKHFEQLRNGFVLMFFFDRLSIYAGPIWYFLKIPFKMKCTCNSMTIPLTISQIVFLPSLSLISLAFESFVLCMRIF